MGAGRPRKFDTPEDLESLCDEYFKGTERPTMSGLCNYLGIPRQTLSDYHKRDDYSDIVKNARQKVEEAVEEALLYDKAGAGAIFWLKNHAGYVDQTQQDVNVKGEFYVSDEPTIDEFDEEFAVGAPTGSADGAG